MSLKYEKSDRVGTRRVRKFAKTRLLTIQDLRVRLHIGPTAAYRLAKRLGRRVGKRFVVAERTLEAWLCGGGR